MWCQLSFASLLLLSSAFFRSILLHLQHFKSVSHNASTWNVQCLFFSFCFIFPIFLIILQTSSIWSSLYFIQFLSITFSPVLIAAPLSTPKSRELLWPHWETLPNPLIEKREEWNRPGCGGAGAFTPHPHPLPPPMGGQKATPSPVFIPLPTYPISLPAVCSQLLSSSYGYYCAFDNYIGWMDGLLLSVNIRAMAYSYYEILKFALTLVEEVSAYSYACDSLLVSGYSQS